MEGARPDEKKKGVTKRTLAKRIQTITQSTPEPSLLEIALSFQLKPQSFPATCPNRLLCFTFHHPTRLLTPIPLDTDYLARALALQIHNNKQLRNLESRPGAMEVHFQLAVDVRALGEDEPLVCHVFGEEAGVESVNLGRWKEEIPWADARVVREWCCCMRVARDARMGGRSAVSARSAGLAGLTGAVGSR